MKHLISQPHIIFSVENSPYPDKVQMPIRHEDALEFLKQNTFSKNVYSLYGYYDRPEKSILIVNPSDEQKEAVRNLAYLTGQDSHIESDGYTHKMIYHHGPNSGKVVMGKGTRFHETKPKNMYSVLPDGTIFTHNFDFENSHIIIEDKKTDKTKKSETSKKYEPLMKPYVSEAQRRWAHTPAGMKALGGKKAVEHWDKESKGKDLPEKIEKALSPEELQAQGYKFKILQPTKTRQAYAVRAYHGRKPIGHLVYSDRSSSPPDQNDPSYGYHEVFNGRIEPEHRGKGIYQHMLRLATNHVKSLGSKGVMSRGYQRSSDATRAWDRVATHVNPYTYNAKLKGKFSPKDSDYYLAALERSNRPFKKSLQKSSLPSAPKVNINPEHGKIIADAYHNMKHDPHHPEVKAAYEALINETKKQFKDMLDQGFKFTKIKPNQENPYKTSRDLHNDIKQNKHLYFFPTEQGFGSGDKQVSDHPMLQPTEFMHEGKPLLANDLFRVVHDYRGHHLGGESTFGPKGEHQAYLTHKKDFSPLAQKALATETLMQNSWVNFGPHGEHNRKNPHQTIYAEQKAAIAPDWIVNGRWHE